jgi:hypothetical protein
VKRSVVAAAGIVGVWTAAAPLALSWQVGLATYGSNILPGVLVAVIGGLAATLRPDDQDAPDEDLQAAIVLMQRSCSYLVVLGAWVMLAPFLLGLPLAGSTYLGTVLPGAAVLALGLANGYYGWTPE